MLRQLTIDNFCSFRERGDLPPAKERHQSRNWKRRFHKNHLGTDRDAEIVSKLRGKCPALFPKELIEKERNTHSSLAAILSFLLPKS